MGPKFEGFPEISPDNKHVDRIQAAIRSDGVPESGFVLGKHDSSDLLERAATDVGFLGRPARTMQGVSSASGIYEVSL